MGRLTLGKEFDEYLRTESDGLLADPVRLSKLADEFANVGAIQPFDIADPMKFYESLPGFSNQDLYNWYRRPSWLVRNDQMETPNSDRWQKITAPYRSAINRRLPAVGKISLQLPDRPSIKDRSTAFLISGDRIVTNRHVVTKFVERHHESVSWISNQAGETRVSKTVNFRGEHGSSAERRFNIGDIEYVANKNQPDLAILKLAESPDIDALTLDTSPILNQFVVTVGYPSRPSINQLDPSRQLFLQFVFGGIFDVKRVSPGEIQKLATKSFQHDCTTLGGNSGSPILDLESGAVVGVHFSGNSSYNQGVLAQELDRVLG